MQNDKMFWNTKHEEDDKYWLSSTSLDTYKHVFNIASLEGKIVIEVGVGRALAARAIALECNELYCVDVSERALDKIRQISRAVPRRFFLPKYFHDMADVCICNLVMQHCEYGECEDLIGSMLSAIRPGTGTLYLQTADLYIDPSEDVFRKMEDKLLFFRPESAYRTMIDRAGGKVLHHYRRGFSEPENRGILWDVFKVTK